MKQVCGSCRINQATHSFLTGRGGRVRVFRCDACTCKEHRSLGFAAAFRYAQGRKRLSNYEVEK